jgi:hypothetical protein
MLFKKKVLRKMFAPKKKKKVNETFRVLYTDVPIKTGG